MSKQLTEVQKRRRRLFILLALLLLVILLIYAYTYFFANKGGKIIYQDATRRIYLTEKKEYKPGREMWKMVYEDQKTGNRYFIIGNSKKGFPNDKMVKVVLNGIDQNKLKNFDMVQSAGFTAKLSKTDINSNTVKKDASDIFGEGFDVPELVM